MVPLGTWAGRTSLEVSEVGSLVVCLPSELPAASPYLYCVASGQGRHCQGLGYRERCRLGAPSASPETHARLAL